MRSDADKTKSSPEESSAAAARLEEERAACYFKAMTNDCADPDDGTARTHEQIREDWRLQGLVDE